MTGCTLASNTVVGGNGYTGGSPGSAGGAGMGAALWNLGGNVFATNCVFLANCTTGGEAGPGSYPAAPAGDASGGAIGSLGGSLIVQSSVFDSNTSQGGSSGGGIVASRAGSAFGGAVWAANGTELYADSTFTRNRALGADWPPDARHPSGPSGSAMGGAIFTTNGAATFRGCLFGTNQVRAGFNKSYLGSMGSAHGGAIWSYGTAVAEQCSFFGNQAIGCPEGASIEVRAGGDGYGGAIFNGSLMFLSASLLAGNNAIGGEGGHLGTSFYPGGNGRGGAIDNSGTLNVTNCTLTGNAASGGNGTFSSALGGSGTGGGLCNRGGTVYLVNLTLSSNRVYGGDGSPDGSPLGGAVFTTNGAVNLINTIAAYSLGGSNAFGALTDLGHNLSSDGSAGFTAPGSLNNTDPVLGPLGDYGGPTLTLPLLSGSPAINGGDPLAYPPTDQRGRTRPFGAGPDIGAFESSPPYSIRGTVSGFTLTGEVSVSDGLNTVTTVDGRYALAGLGANPYTVTPQSANCLFVPANRSVTVGPDRVGVDFKAYRWNMLSLDDVNGGVMHVVFAATNGLNYRLLNSANLVQWAAVSNYTMGPSQYWELFLPMSGGPGFYRAVTP